MRDSQPRCIAMRIHATLQLRCYLRIVAVVCIPRFANRLLRWVPHRQIHTLQSFFTEAISNIMEALPDLHRPLKTVLKARKTTPNPQHIAWTDANLLLFSFYKTLRRHLKSSVRISHLNQRMKHEQITFRRQLWEIHKLIYLNSRPLFSVSSSFYQRLLSTAFVNTGWFDGNVIIQMRISR